MKKLIANYTFNASAKTVTFGDYETIELGRILLVSNVTRGTDIYNFLSSTKGGTVSTNVLTLTYDTAAAGMANSDILLIYYDDDDYRQKIEVHDQYKTRKYIPYQFTATTAGTIVGVQGKTLLASVMITSAGAANSQVKIYDSYYTTSALKYTFDGATVYNWKMPGEGTILTSGCFLVITSSGTSPIVTIHSRPII